jgi:hypothetical protein
MSCTDKKEEKNFPHMSGNSEGSSCKVIYEEMRKFLVIYEEEAVCYTVYDFATAPY